MALSKEIFPNSKLEPPESIQKLLKLTTVQLVGGIKCDLCKITFSTKQPYDSHYLNHCNNKTLIKYTCVVCDKTYPAYHTFRDHCYMQHVLKDKFKCSECGKCFPKISVLNDHVSAVHTFRCLLTKSCKKKKFKTKAELHHHQMVHKNNKNKPPYNCKSCQKQIHNPDDCELHIDAHVALTYSCPICDQHIATENAKSHLTTHFTDETPDGKRQHQHDDTNPNTMDTPSDSSINTIGGVRCCHCNQLFKDKTEIDLHFMEYHTDEEITYTCNICKKQFVKYTLFGDHCYFHYSKTRFECEKCFKSFDRLYYLISHKEKCTSTGQTSFTCAVCNGRYPSDLGLQRHMRRVGHQANDLQCAHTGCNATFESQKELLLHRKCNHEGHKNFCKTCGMDFQTLESCYKHLDVHKKQQFICPVCDHLSQDKYKMMMHIPKHFTTMFHVCKICGKIYEENRRFIEHTKTHHNEKNHKCNYCGKSFAKSNHLQQHIQIHTGMKPYKCVACPKVFASYPNWNKHLRKIHNIDAKTVKRPDVNIDQVNLPKSLVTKATELTTPVTKVTEPTTLVTEVTEPASPVTKVTEPTTLVTKVTEPTTPVTKVIEPTTLVTKLTEPATSVTKVTEPTTLETNSTDFNEFEDDSMDSDTDVENEINAIEKSLADSIDNTTVHPEIVEIPGIINNNHIAFRFDENYKNATVNNNIKFLITDEITDNIKPTFDFGEKTKQNASDIDIVMELQEHLNGDAVHETESEMLEELLDIGVLPEPPHHVVSHNIPQMEYGPDFINADSTLPSTSPGELINLDDHLLPHIDPLLTINCEAGPEYTNLTNLTTLTNQYTYDYENGQINEMNYQNDPGFLNSLYLYDHNDLSDKTEVAQPNLVWGPTTIFTSYV